MENNFKVIKDLHDVLQCIIDFLVALGRDLVNSVVLASVSTVVKRR